MIKSDYPINKMLPQSHAKTIEQVRQMPEYAKAVERAHRQSAQENIEYYVSYNRYNEFFVSTHPDTCRQFILYSTVRGDGRGFIASFRDQLKDVPKGAARGRKTVGKGL